MLAIACLAAGAIGAEKKDVSVAPRDVDTPLYNSSYEMYVVPTEVTRGIRVGWCQDQAMACMVLCKFQVNTAECDYSDLTWKCLCHADNKMPPLNKYVQSIPSMICYTLASQCVDRYKERQHIWGGFTEENPELLQRCWDEIEVHCGTRNLSFLRFNGAGPLAEGRGMMHVLRELEAKGFYTEEYWEERGS